MPKTPDPLDVPMSALIRTANEAPFEKPEVPVVPAKPLTIYLYPDDNRRIDEVVAEGLRHGHRLNASQAIRLLMRNADIGRITSVSFHAIARQDDRRRARRDRMARQ